ncbi:Peptidase family M28 [Tsuneonella dongtanensis]|uniref:Peptidase family M28 n=1 Tax=Tsuneonella dongtanensis TaxID=692370 RepID=A0A1B2A9Q5_9SPHN|nr:M28 family metallopeptidase [Tsuneonella dongtanensis]ANY18897.1 Peptidase family M28 [Tsuneonella dongtanensis]
MTVRTLLAAAAAFSLAACSMSATTDGAGTSDALEVPDVAAGALSEETMRAAVEQLASDEFEGRAPGTLGEEKTVAYLIEQFEKAGLKPGNNGSWIQKAPLVEIAGSGHAPLTVTGKDGKTQSFTYGSDWVGATYREAPEVTIADSELVFVGYGIVAPEKGWNDYAGIDMKGKTAVILVNDPDYEAKELGGEFNGRGMTYYGRWTYKFEEAARQGATAALIVHDDFPAAYGWNVVESSWTGPQVYAQRSDKGASQTMMNGWVQKAVAGKILAAGGQDLAKLSAAAKKKGFKPVSLGVKTSTSFSNAIRTFESQNVVGLLEGTEAKDEYVLYTAHWDHIGRCKADAGGDDICNGAIDNATGTAALIALAEANAKAGPARRSQVFLAVTAEESGLLGSEYYAANPIFPLSQTVGGINIDGMPMGGRSKDVVAIGGAKSQLDAFLDKFVTAEKLTLNLEPTPEKGFYYRSDHFNLAKVGVPMLYLKGGDDFEAGGRAAGEAYQKKWTEEIYHQPSDEFDPNWDWGGAMQILQLYYRIGRSMAMSSGWPTWNDGDEFRGARDKSCAAEGGC